MKIVIVKASDYLTKRFSERAEQLIASEVVLVPINDAYIAHLNRPERFQIFYGGSGSGKSHFVATLLLLRALKKERFRCMYVRKYERSVRDSQFALFQDLISSLGLSSVFEVNRSDM
ncbi:MAG: phage terminase large subunit, partial [Saprospiraceae bacterium]|nr:phage terminase large subunit [Saprospiraceae bacterium]MDW8485397.1 phage terminase large subunit [Saprospiraceae bacterium]